MCKDRFEYQLCSSLAAKNRRQLCVFVFTPKWAVKSSRRARRIFSTITISLQQIGVTVHSQFFWTRCIKRAMSAATWNETFVFESTDVAYEKICINMYRELIKYCVFLLCQFCCSACVLPAWWVYTDWHRGKTEKGQSPEYFKIFGKKHNF